MSKFVYVVFCNVPKEGRTEPEVVFDSEEKAIAHCAKWQEKYGTFLTVEYVKLELK